MRAQRTSCRSDKVYVDSFARPRLDRQLKKFQGQKIFYRLSYSWYQLHMSFLPWERYPALEEDRLIAVADAIRRGRRSAVRDFNPDEGDNAWTLGVLAYARGCFALTEASKLYDWLNIIPEANNRFTFTIGDVAMKFYRGDPEDPPSRSLAISFAELSYIQQKLFEDMGEDRVLRLAVETDSYGDVRLVSLVEISGGSVRNVYAIPMISPAVVPMAARPVDPGPPPLSPIESDEETNRRTGTEDNASQ